MSNKTDSVSVQMAEILKEYVSEVDETISDATAKAAKKTAATLRSNSPKKTGEYASGWRSKKMGDKEAIVYNSKMPGLTHLLENGHVVVNSKGIVGRANGIKHIEPAAEEGVEDYIEKLRKDLQEV